MAMATALRSAGRRFLAGQLPSQGICVVAAAKEQRRLLPTAIHGGGSLGYSRQYGIFEAVLLKLELAAEGPSCSYYYDDLWLPLTYSLVSISLTPACSNIISWLQRCMRVGDLFVRATTAVSIIAVSTAVLTLSVAMPVKLIRGSKKPQDMRRGQPSRFQCNEPSVEDKMQELREVLLEYEAQRRAQG